MRIYMGNLPYGLGSEELAELCSQHGEVAHANVIMDPETGRSKGFGFVEMPKAEEAKAAIDALNASPVSGRTLRVSEARPRPGGDMGGGGPARRPRPGPRNR